MVELGFEIDGIRYKDWDDYMYKKYYGEKCGKCNHIVSSHVPTHPEGLSESRMVYCKECYDKERNWPKCNGMLISGQYFSSVMHMPELKSHYNKPTKEETRNDRIPVWGPFFFVNGELGSGPEYIDKTIKYDIMDYDWPSEKSKRNRDFTVRNYT